MDAKTTQEFIKTFHFLQKFDCNAAIDEMFLKLINEDWTQESLATNKLLIVIFLRTNFLIQNNLQYYNQFLNKSIDYLKQNQLEPKNLLHGII